MYLFGSSNFLSFILQLLQLLHLIRAIHRHVAAMLYATQAHALVYLVTLGTHTRDVAWNVVPMVNVHQPVHVRAENASIHVQEHVVLEPLVP